jgi:hypothetical protein
MLVHWCVCHVAEVEGAICTVDLKHNSQATHHTACSAIHHVFGADPAQLQ